MNEEDLEGSLKLSVEDNKGKEFKRCEKLLSGLKFSYKCKMPTILQDMNIVIIIIL